MRIDLQAGSGTVGVSDLIAVAAEVDGRADRAIALAVDLGHRVPAPATGHTAARWETLATVAAADLTGGRVAEAHLDALAILAESELEIGHPALGALGVSQFSTWGVFAAEGPGVRLDAVEESGRWVLSGTKPWCSLADRLSHALITAHTDTGRRLFAVALRTPNVHVSAGEWASRGLADVPSGPIEVRNAAAVPVGRSGWYLERPGFAWGGIGVAACWFGGAVALARALHAKISAREPDQIGLMHLGAVDAAIHRARCVLAAAAVDVDAGRATGPLGVVLAARVREVVAGTAEEILQRVGHALGPAPLAMDEEHARRVADLEIYLRQHHAERDQAALGKSLCGGDPPW